MRQLKVADKLAFRIWLLSSGLKVGALCGGLALLGWIGFLAYAHWRATAFSLTIGALLTAVVCAAVGLAGWGGLAKSIQYRKTLQSVIVGLAMGTVGWLLARLHLHVFDRWFLRQGRLSAVSPDAASEPRSS